MAIWPELSCLSMSREEEEENNGGDFADLPDFLCDNDEIDRMIEERAGAFNLTGTNIRNILYVSRK